MARALLIDLDGTLADSLGVMRTAYESLLLEYGREPMEEEFSALNGPPLAECARYLKGSHGLADNVETIVGRWLQIIEEGYAGVEPAAGARELLEAARGAGWRVAVVTSGPRALARAWLARVGFGLLVDAIVGGEDVKRGKPDPAPYIEAMGRLAVEPRDCVAVEDSATGAAAALAAGARTYVIEPARLFAPRGMHRLRSLQDLMRVIG